MKKLLLSLLVLFFLNTTQAATISPVLNSMLPLEVLFNFQVDNDLAFPTPPMDDYASTPGFTIQAVATAGTVPTPWLDGDDGSVDLPGGLGACLTNDCNSSNDDAFQIGESVLLTYTGLIQITLGHIFFTEGDHTSDFSDGGFFDISVNGGIRQTFALEAVFTGLANVLLNPGETVEFFYADRSDKPAEFYVGGFGQVPIPAALPLFLSGLFGFAFFSRKKKVATA